MTHASSSLRSTAQQLAEFLAVVTAAGDGAAAERDGVERMAESVEAEIGVLLRDRRVRTAVGFGIGPSPIEELLAVVDRHRSTISVPGTGACPAVAVPVGDDAVVLARSGGEGFDAAEVSLLRGMGRVLSLALDTIRVLDSLRESEQFALSALDNASEAYVAIDDDHCIAAWNRQAHTLFGWSSEEAIGKDFVTLLVPEPRPGAMRAEMTALQSEASCPPRHEAIALRRDGTEVPVEVGFWTTRRAGAQVIHAFVHDLSKRKAAEEVMAHQALHDPLTGLPNRVLFLDRLNQAVIHLRRSSRRLAVLFIDLDRFKAVNDRLGHAAGDVVLRAVTSRILEVLRPGDTVARLGGDEFTVLCQDVGDEHAALDVAARICQAVSAPIDIDGRVASVSVSIGIAQTRDATVLGTELIRDADSAMYQAKELGRNRFQVFDERMRVHSELRIDRTHALRRAIEERELHVAYQPVLSFADDSLCGAEALVRWDHPTQGAIGPDEFIPLAEASGLVVQIGAFVLAEACGELMSWQPWHSMRPLPSIAVNLSARQLSEPDLIDTVQKVLAETGLDPSRLCLEITESVLMEDIETSTEALLGLKMLGVRLAIDDFGTGYSSLSYLRRLPVDIVKIDRSFVTVLGVDPAADAIVGAVVSLGHSLGLEVIAEGVETKQQREALRSLGCDAGQGFLWSRPLAAHDMRTWVTTPRAEGLRQESVDVRGSIERVLARRPSFSGHAVISDLPGRLAAARGDEVAVSNVLERLLDVASRSTVDDKPVVITASHDRRWVRVSVTGLGNPIPSQATNLAAVHDLIGAMGGRVGRRSTGESASYTFVLPRYVSRTSPRQAGHVLAAPSLREEFLRQMGVAGDL